MIDLYVTVQTNDEADEQELVDIAKNLEKELIQLNAIESIEPVRVTQLTEGEKGSAIEPGSLLLKVAETGGFASLVSMLGSWLGRDKSRTLKLQIGDKSLEVTGLSKSEQESLIEWFQIQAGLRFEK